ncbi:MAG: ATP-binding cassette domain-containing protein [Polyangiaceae bacterium]
MSATGSTTTGSTSTTTSVAEIKLHGLTARDAPLAIAPLTIELGPGIHALLGTHADGVGLLLAVLAGAHAVRAGRVEALGLPLTSDAVRKEIGYVPLDLKLPDPWTVVETLRAADAIRGEPERDQVQRLAVLGLAPLASRRARTLSAEEARAVALAEALTSTKVRVLLLEEPFVKMDARAAAAFPAILRERARAGACVVISTASTREAAELADDHLTFDRGTLVKRAPSGERLALEGPDGARIRIVATPADARLLVAALASEADVTAIATEADGMIVVTGRDLLSLAAAVGKAIRHAKVDIEMLRPEPLPLDELRAATAGDVAGAYRAAFERAAATSAASTTPPAAPPPAEAAPPETA